MSYQEKRSIASIFTGIAVLAAYCIYAFGRYRSGLLLQDDLKAWATTMLIFIGIGIAAAILIQIVFHILLSISVAVREKIRDQECDDKEIEASIKADMVEDERDRLIELKSSRVGFFLTGIGFACGLISLALGQPAMVMLNIVFISLSAASLVEGLTQIYFYRKGG